MARYTINYITGETETVDAEGVEYDIDARDYTFTGSDGKGVAALAPTASVRSVIRQADIESNLVDHARRELALVGEDEWLTDGLCKVIAAFAEMGHSGFSAEHCTVVLEKLLRYQPLSPITDDPSEWIDRAREMGGEPFWQNTRDSRAMSTDGGKTYTLVDEKPQDSDSGHPVHTSQHKQATD